MPPSQEKILRKARQLRADYERLSRSVFFPQVAVGSYREITLELIPGYRTKLLVYTPERADRTALPAYLVLHSGAFVRGSAYLDHYFNSVTANRAGCAVIAVEFQLAPEAQFPVQVEECYASAKWVWQHAGELGVDADRLALGGHNSGGTLAAVVSHLVRDRGEFSLRCVLLDCAMFTLAGPENELPDFDEDDPLRGPVRGAFFNTCYLGDPTLAETDPLASPLYEASLEGLPPTLVVIAGLDAARPGAEQYFARLQKAGNDCRLICHEGLPHGFNVQPGLAPRETVERSFTLLDGYLKEYLHPPKTCTKYGADGCAPMGQFLTGT